MKFIEKVKRLTANTGFASGGVTCKLGACAILVQCRLTVLCSSPLNAKPQNVTLAFMPKDYILLNEVKKLLTKFPPGGEYFS